MTKRILLLFLIFAACSSAKPPRSPAPPSSNQDTLQVGKTLLTLEIANTDSLRTQGLSDRRTLDWNHGMLFAFPDADQRSFWMIRCHFDLDIAYISPNGIVRDIQTMFAQPGASPRELARYPSATNDIMYALEVNRGWLAAHGVKVGQTFPGILRQKTSR